MNSIYQAMGTSKQNVHQRINRQIKQLEEEQQLIRIVYQVREDHPAMGLKTLYKKLRPAMGRDRFYAWYRNQGLLIKPRKNWRRTTDSSGVIRFKNLTLDVKLTAVNQLWVSDITYYEIDEKFYYLTFIMDQYSRKIKGYSISRTLKTEDTTIPALTMAMKSVSLENKIIFHSDGGGQYYSKNFLALTQRRFANSMGKSAYENPFSERLNRTIKNDYVRHYGPGNFYQLKTMVAKAVLMYNEDKPHGALDGLTPSQFEMVNLNQSVN